MREVETECLSRRGVQMVMVKEYKEINKIEVLKENEVWEVAMFG